MHDILSNRQGSDKQEPNDTRKKSNIDVPLRTRADDGAVLRCRAGRDGARRPCRKVRDDRSRRSQDDESEEDLRKNRMTHHVSWRKATDLKTMTQKKVTTTTSDDHDK